MHYHSRHLTFLLASARSRLIATRQAHDLRCWIACIERPNFLLSLRSVGRSAAVISASSSGAERCPLRRLFFCGCPTRSPKIDSGAHQLTSQAFSTTAARSWCVTLFTSVPAVPSGALHENAVGSSECGAVIAKKLDYALTADIESPSFVPFRANPEDANCRLERVDILLHRQKL